MLYSLKSVVKSYDKRIIIDINLFEIEKGETIGITGPSGSGKTTFLNLLGALDKPDTGEILFNKQNINNLSEKKVSYFRNQKIGFIFQKHLLLPQLNVLENILLPTLAIKSGINSAFKQRAEYLLQRVGLMKFKLELPGKLSVGECQRVAFVRALICNPEVILADEPTGSIDQETADNLAELLIELNSETGTTLVVVTHSEKLALKMQKKYYLSQTKLIPY